MAQRRMFSPQIIDSDAFLDMPASAQSLYFHLGMRADDDGFVGNPKRILKTIGGNDDDLKILIGKRFVLIFETGVIVIKHWRINNLVRKDWYRETAYLEEKQSLRIKENGSYTEINKPTKLDSPNLVNENTTTRSRRLGKVRLGKDSISTSVSNETNDDISSKELEYVPDLEEYKKPKRATRQKPGERKLSMKLIDHLKHIKKMTVPDGRFQEDNIYPCASLVNKMKATLLAEKKEQTDEEILKLFDYIMNKLSDWHWERATSIKYISNNYYKIYEEIKNGQRK